MSGKGQPSKRKAESNLAQESKKPKQQQQQQPAQQPKKKEQQQQQQPKKEQKQQPKKEPEPEPESEEDEEDEEDDEMPMGEPDEEALAEIAKVQPAMDKIFAELEAFDEQMNAEIYAIQKKFLLKKRPIFKKRDDLLKSVPNLWRKLFTEHTTFLAQLDEIDIELLENLVAVEEEQVYADDKAEKQQIIGIKIFFTFTGSKHLKAGRYEKQFTFSDDDETLICVPVEKSKLPFVAGEFGTKYPDSFLLAWFTSEGADDGILAAQDALTSELLVDPLQLYTMVAEGKPLPTRDGSDDEDDEEAALMFNEDDEIEEDDEDAPQLVD